MTEITQADRDAMESILWVDTIIDDKEAIAKAFARHRQVAVEALSAEVERLRDVLRFYADENNPYPNEGPWGVDSNDFGYRARAALEQSK